MRRVIADQGYSVADAVLQRIAQSVNSDIRQMLNLLQMWRPEGGRELSSVDVTKRLETAYKDVDVGPFDITDKFFKEPDAPLDKRLRNYFVDSSMTPLLVQVSVKRFFSIHSAWTFMCCCIDCSGQLPERQLEFAIDLDCAAGPHGSRALHNGL